MLLAVGLAFVGDRDMKCSYSSGLDGRKLEQREICYKCPHKPICRVQGHDM